MIPPTGAINLARGALALLPLLACHAPPTAPGTRLERRGDEIAICGQLFHTGTRVVLWHDPGGYDAYRPWFGDALDASGGAAPPAKLNFSPIRRGIPAAMRERVLHGGWRLEDLQRVVRLFVLHYDAAGRSKGCFTTLQHRGLSVHFLLDVDGTIYQTLDLKERAWHATVANDHSIGIEIAHVGAYQAPGHPAIRRFYYRDDDGRVRGRFPPEIRDTGVRTPSFQPVPARQELLRGTINGRAVYQYDFTDAQYRALAKLTAALARIFPRIALRVPRAPDGSVRDSALSSAQLAAFEGILGHWHVQTNKIDPGPAFDWDRLLRESR